MQHQTCAPQHHHSATITDQKALERSSHEDDKFEAIKQCASALFEQQTRNLAQTAEMQVVLQALVEREKELRQRHHLLQDLAAQLDSDVTMCTQRNAERKQALSELDGAIQRVHAYHGQLQGSIQHVETVTTAVGAFVADTFDDDEGVVSAFLQLSTTSLSNLQPADLRTLAADVRKMATACCAFVDDVRALAPNVGGATIDESSPPLDIGGAHLQAQCAHLRSAIDKWVQQHDGSGAECTRQAVSALVDAQGPSGSLIAALRTLSSLLRSSGNGVLNAHKEGFAVATPSLEEVRNNVGALLTAFTTAEFTSAEWHSCMQELLGWIGTFCITMQPEVVRVLQEAQSARLHLHDGVHTALTDAFHPACARAPSSDTAPPFHDMANRLSGGLRLLAAVEALRQASTEVRDTLSSTEAKHATAMQRLDAAQVHNTLCTQVLCEAEAALAQQEAAIVVIESQHAQHQEEAEVMQQQLSAEKVMEEATILRALDALESLWVAPAPSGADDATAPPAGDVIDWDTARKLEWDSIVLDAEHQRLTAQLRACEESTDTAVTRLSALQGDASVMVGRIQHLATHAQTYESATKPYAQDQGTDLSSMESSTSSCELLEGALETLQQLHTVTIHKHGESRVHALTAEVCGLSATSDELEKERARLVALLESLGCTTGMETADSP